MTQQGNGSQQGWGNGESRSSWGDGVHDEATRVSGPVQEPPYADPRQHAQRQAYPYEQPQRGGGSYQQQHPQQQYQQNHYPQGQQYGSQAPGMYQGPPQGYPQGQNVPAQFAPQGMYMPPGRVDPYTGEQLSDKQKVVAGLLQLFFGMFGAGRFYIGDTKTGGIQLALFLVGFLGLILLVGVFVLGAVAMWAFIDAILMFTGSVRDPYGRRLS